MRRNNRLSFMTIAGVVALVSVGIIKTPAVAVEPDEILADATLEARAREISRELRCVTCQSQSIDDSNAPLAKDLRVVVRERVIAGDSNDEVIAYVTDRYGDYVRMKPELRGDTMVLWLTPALALGGALLGAFFYFRQLRQKTDGNTEDDQEDNVVP